MARKETVRVEYSGPKEINGLDCVKLVVVIDRFVPIEMADTISDLAIEALCFADEKEQTNDHD